MSFKYKNLSKSLLCMLMPTLAAVSGCTGRDTSVIDAEIAKAQAELDSISALCVEASATCGMYKQKCDSLEPVFGVKEPAAERQRKNQEWRQYRDSVSKYNDQAIILDISRDAAQLRLNRLVAQRNVMKLR